ncbi:MAG: hypothetical protein K0V04_11435, partial [Deltaproteobacteria bacterium]|nr:hypothetical protein [Deltaproteobacteria bacterium]
LPEDATNSTSALPTNPELGLSQATAEQLASLQTQAEALTTPPAVEVVTEDGAYVAFFMSEDDEVALFEWVPDGVEGPVRSSSAITAAELYRSIAPESEVPSVLLTAAPFTRAPRDSSDLESQLGPEDLIDDEGPVIAPTTVGCTKSKANAFYNGYRPGAYNTEKVNQSAGPEARRRKYAQAFWQTSGYTQWTPKTSQGGLKGYLRTSTAACQGQIRLTAWRCRTGFPTADNGCGEPGSAILQTYGPFAFSSGHGTYTLSNQWNDLLRARMDWVSNNDIAGWSYFHGPYSTGEINNCYY